MGGWVGGGSRSGGRRGRSGKEEEAGSVYKGSGGRAYKASALQACMLHTTAPMEREVLSR